MRCTSLRLCLRRSSPGGKVARLALKRRLSSRNFPDPKVQNPCTSSMIAHGSIQSRPKAGRLSEVLADESVACLDASSGLFVGHLGPPWKGGRRDAYPVSHASPL